LSSTSRMRISLNDPPLRRGIRSETDFQAVARKKQF
jgi:hypothetical protein